ncbi:MAG: hypothetical protein RL701_1901 [Pseudomonadota bacterium]|jgi:hypothetical protein
MRSTRVFLLLLLAIWLCGCELIADFDRGKLDGGSDPGLVVDDDAAAGPSAD